MELPLRKKYQVVVDENMPGIDVLFSDIANIIRRDGRSITADCLQNTDALLCRSITSVTQELLQNSKLKFVGTATIGTDHLAIDWLDSQNIQWANAAGCNAAAVAQYVLSAIAYWSKNNSNDIQQLKVGIVGAGNVGTELARCLDLLKIDYLLCDPPLAAQGDPRSMVSLQQVLKCDVISLHVPLTIQGPHETKHLFNSSLLKKLTSHQLLINASRGAVIDNHALLGYLQKPNAARIILDVFENEPNPPIELLDGCLLATPHIAGHTLEGKLRGSWMIYQAFCHAFALKLNKTESELYPAYNQITLANDNLVEKLLAIYDIQAESNRFVQQNNETMAVKFDRLRKNATQLTNGYTRRDYSGWCYQGQINLPL